MISAFAVSCRTPRSETWNRAFSRSSVEPGTLARVFAILRESMIFVTWRFEITQSRNHQIVLLCYPAAAVRSDL